MDSPLVSSIFRTLFHRRAVGLCQARRRLGPPTYTSIISRQYYQSPLFTTSVNSNDGSSQCPHIHHPRRSLATKSKPPIHTDVAWQPRSLHMYQDFTEEYKSYPMVTAKELASRRERPKRVKMLVRDFIDDSLYNPHYGYFSKEAVIFSTPEPFDFPSIRDELEFHKLLSEKYTAFEDALDAESPNDARQLWHTPTELFKPHYGSAIARYLVTNYKLSLYPYHDLHIYEMGAGNGTLMTNVLDYIRETDPDVYQRTHYKVIEISAQLNAHQRNAIAKAGHENKVELINKSIFDWDIYVPNPCFFLALEVFDNFAHDMIRYSYSPTSSKPTPLQGTVLIDSQGDFHEFYTPDLDPLVSHYLALRSRALRKPTPNTSPLQPIKSLLSPLISKLAASLPFTTNLSQPTFLPTNLLSFFTLLNSHFPSHRLITSDFSSLPTLIRGTNAPVVQTRYKRTTVPVSTVFVQQGYFDILFPTDFAEMEDVYRAVTGRLTRVVKHEEFMRRWVNVDETRTKSGESPLLSWYKNAMVMSSV